MRLTNAITLPATVLAIFIALVPIAATAQPDCGTPASGQDGWEVATPEASGLDPAILCGIGPRFQAWSAADVHAVLVVRHGKLVYERYFTGQDEHHGRPLGAVAYNASMPHDLRSITKSIVSLVVGIAVGRGQFPDVDQPVLAQLPQCADLRSPEKDKITIRHLLTMSQGLVWNEDLPYSDPRNNEEGMDEAPDPVRYALEQPVDAPPGLIFNYSGGSAQVLSAILHKTTGQDIDAYARATLFEPLGIKNYEWLRLSSGEPLAASGLRMRPRDLVKIGQLVLDHGAWHGTQIVPADWIAAAASPQINGPLTWFYGYQFWLGRSLVNRREIDWAVGLGLGGQRLFIVPALDLLVLVHAGLYHSPIQGAVPLQALNRYVLPAVKGP